MSIALFDKKMSPANYSHKNHKYKEDLVKNIHQKVMSP